MKLVYKCRECGKPFVTEAALSEHIRSGHMIQIKEYYDKYVAGENEGNGTIKLVLIDIETMEIFAEGKAAIACVTQQMLDEAQKLFDSLMQEYFG